MSDLCLAQVDPQGPLHEPLSLMRDSAHQASLLLQRLTRLIYDPSGTATYHDLNDITSEMADIMRRVLARHVDLQLQLCEVALPVLVDAVELRKALIYLVLDFAAGFPGAGRIVVSTRLSVEPIAHVGFWGCVPATPVVSVGISRDEAGWTADETERLASIMEGVGRSGADAARLRLVRDFAQKHGGGLCLREELSGRQLELCLPRADLDKAL